MLDLSDLLLLSDKQLDGPRRVGMTLRPQRLAFLVDPADTAVALAAIDAACLGWGGAFQFLIPCPPAGRPSPIWSRVLERHDPDAIVDLIGVDESFRSEQGSRWDRSVHRWERPTETMVLVGAVIYSSLRRWRRLRPAGTTHLAVNLHPLADHPLALPLAFRFGHLDKRPMARSQIIRGAYESAQHQDFVDLRTIDPFRLAGEDLVRLATQVPLDLTTLAPGRGGQNVYLDLPELTTIGLPRREPPYWHEDRPHPEHEQHDEAFFRRVIVVGRPSSVPDLCLAWNLRAQRAWDWYFPLWVSPEWLSDPGVRHSVAWALHWGSAGLSERDEGRTVHLVSATLAPDEISCHIREGYPDAVLHAPDTLDRFFTGGFRVGLQRESIANVRRGLVDAAVPDYADLGDWEHPQRIGWTLAIGGYDAPRATWREFRRLRGVVSRMAADGIAGFITVPDEPPGTFMPVSTNNGWEIVAAVASRAGYVAHISDKGRRAIALMRLLGGEPGLRVLASSRVYRLLVTMAQIVERQAVQQAVRRRVEGIVTAEQADALGESVWRDVTEGGQFDRQHLTWDGIRKGLDVSPEDCNALIEWLVQRRVLFQGYDFTCPECGMRRWHPINRLADTQLCDGCQAVSLKPITPNVLQWRYRLNEAVAQAVDQGVLPHLLAVRRMSEWTADRRAPLLGLLPGLQPEPREACGPPEIEVDLFAIKGGRAVVGECKAGGDRITDKTVGRFAELGRLLDCSRIIYATTTDFIADAEAIDRAKTLGGSTAVEVWEAGDLFDSGFIPGEGRDPARYLTTVLAGLGDGSV